MRYVIRGFVACVFVACMCGAGILYYLSAPVPDIEAPKQSHHVVYFWVCDDFIGALLTISLPIWLDANGGMLNDENVALMLSAFEAGNSVVVSQQHRGCPIKPLPKKSEST